MYLHGRYSVLTLDPLVEQAAPGSPAVMPFVTCNANLMVQARTSEKLRVGGEGDIRYPL